MKRNAPKFPTGRLIKVEAIELDGRGRVKRVKIRDKELKKLKRANPKRAKKRPAKKKAKKGKR